MWNRPRGLRETVVRALAKVGLVWALAVLGALFMTMSALGQDGDGGYSLAAAGSSASSLAPSSTDAPRTAGLALALVVLAAGISVLAVGAFRGEREVVRRYDPEPHPAGDLPLALGLTLLA